MEHQPCHLPFVAFSCLLGLLLLVAQSADGMPAHRRASIFDTADDDEQVAPFASAAGVKRHFDTLGGGYLLPARRSGGSADAMRAFPFRRIATDDDDGRLEPFASAAEIKRRSFVFDVLSDDDEDRVAPLFAAEIKRNFDTLGGGYLLPDRRSVAVDSNEDTADGQAAVHRRNFDSLGGGLILQEKRHV